MRERVALVVQYADLAAVGLRVPEDVPGDVHRGDVRLDLVVPPADAVHPDDVGHGVTAAAVVEGVRQLRPDVLGEVRQVGVVERLQELLGDQVDDVRAAQADDHVERDGAGRELGDRLVGRVVGGDLDRGSELLLELLDRHRVDVVGVVVDPQRPLLGRPSFRYRPVVGRDRPGDRVVGPRQREAARPYGLWHDEPGGRAGRPSGRDADRLSRVLATREESSGAQAQRRACCPAQELPPRQSASVLRMLHADAGGLNLGPDRQVKSVRAA